MVGKMVKEAGGEASAVKEGMVTQAEERALA